MDTKYAFTGMALFLGAGVLIGYLIWHSAQTPGQTSDLHGTAQESPIVIADGSLLFGSGYPLFDTVDDRNIKVHDKKGSQVTGISCLLYCSSDTSVKLKDKDNWHITFNDSANVISQNPQLQNEFSIHLTDKFTSSPYMVVVSTL